MKISRLLTSLFVLIPLLYGIFVYFLVDTLIRNNIKSSTEDTALQSIRHLSEMSRIHFLSGRFNNPPVSGRPVSAFAFINKNGEIISQFGNIALLNDVKTTTPTVVSMSDHGITVTAPVYFENRDPVIKTKKSPVGFITTVFRIDYERQIIKTVMAVLLSAFFFVSIITIPVAFILAKKLSANLLEIIASIESAESKESVQLSQKISVKTRLIEVSALIDAFNRYIDKLTTLQQINRTYSENLKREVKTSIRDKHAMLAAFSHEMRIPLHVIQTHAHLIKQDLPFIGKEVLTISFQQSLDAIIEAESSILKRTENILAVYKKDHIIINPECLDLTKWCQEFTDFIRPLIVSSGHEFVIENHLKLTALSVDQCLLEQILMILIDNACKYTEHGVITFKIVMRKSNMIGFEVKDTGQGIHRNDLKTVFDPMTQMNPNNPQKGLGIGLYLAMKLARAHGGTICCKSTTNAGSRFIVMIPYSQHIKHSGIAIANVETKPDVNSKKVL